MNFYIIVIFELLIHFWTMHIIYIHVHVFYFGLQGVFLHWCLFASKLVMGLELNKTLENLSPSWSSVTSGAVDRIPGLPDGATWLIRLQKEEPACWCHIIGRQFRTSWTGEFVMMVAMGPWKSCELSRTSWPDWTVSSGCSASGSQYFVYRPHIVIHLDWSLAYICMLCIKLVTLF